MMPYTNQGPSVKVEFRGVEVQAHDKEEKQVVESACGLNKSYNLKYVPNTYQLPTLPRDASLRSCLDVLLCMLYNVSEYALQYMKYQGGRSCLLIQKTN